MSDLLMPRDVIQHITDHAVEAFPRECCGLLIGQREGAAATCETAHASMNVTNGDPHRTFEIDPKLRFDLMRQYDRADDEREIIGHYHSHPNGSAEPSAADLAMTYETEFLWVICAVSPTGAAELSAFKPRANREAFDAWELVEI